MKIASPAVRVPLLPILLALVACGSARAAPTTPDGNRLFAACVACHQPNAWGSADGTIPNLAGQRRRYLEKQLAMFRSGVRVDESMQAVTAHPTFAEPRNIAVLATYLSALDANPAPVTGPGNHLRAAQDLYDHVCTACHGPAGRGQEANRVPRIAGQHYPYLRKQIESAAEFHRDLAPPEMTSALRGMSPAEKDALADYVSRLGNSKVP
jgi:cytochrome c553